MNISLNLRFLLDESASSADVARLLRNAANRIEDLNYVDCLRTSKDTTRDITRAVLNGTLNVGSYSLRKE